MNPRPEIRKMTYAGSFYPAETSDLSRMMDGLFSEAAHLGPVRDAKPRALIVPHAGYMFSGLVAAKAYSQLEHHGYSGVILFGPFHYRPGKGKYFRGAAPGMYTEMQTPFGPIPYDRKTASKLTAALGTSPQELAHSLEHSLEVQLPFIARALPGVPVSTVLIGDFELEDTSRLADVVNERLDAGDYLILASTDLSHHYPYDTAMDLDEKSLGFIEAQDVEGLYNWNNEAGGMLCGAGGVLSLMQIAKKRGWDSPARLMYQNSGDRSGGKSEVVGYAALAYYDEEE